ncbi:MAG: T9SS type A sorting domain-containing protein [Bacteroidales bacterium]|nr:T9SS type A sorting domain-containing protein [Bacteroidales bacterium]
MKKTGILLAIVAAFLGNLQAQELFNKNYQNTEGSGNWINSCMIMHDGDFILNGGYSDTLINCNTVWSRGAFFLSINNEGEIQTKKHYASCNKKIYEGLNRSLISSGNEIYTCGDIYYLNSDTTAFFIAKLNDQIDTVSYREYLVDTTSKRGWNLTKTSDGGIVICGGVDTTHSEYNPISTFVEVFLYKTNSIGDFLWQKKYRFFENYSYNYAGGLNVVEAYDKGFIVSGICKPQTGVNRNFILKTDSLGNQQWVRFYGNSSYDNPTFSDIIATKDSCYIVCGAYTYGETFGGLYPYDGWLIKLDNNGNEKWNKKYRDYVVENTDWRDTIYNVFNSIVELEDGRIAAVATSHDGVIYGRKPKLYLLNSVGDTIMTKLFEKPTYWYNPTSIVLTDDGGFAIAGNGEFVEWNEETSSWESSQRIFLIKTDSLGNDTLLSNISPYEAKSITNFDLVCYPNPASSEFFVDLPQGTEDDVLEIYSINGALVHEQAVGVFNNRVDVCNVKPGMYLVKLRGKGVFGKLVKD